ncbi:MAG: ATP-binding protein, partial [Oscillochloridaceae bacterium]|nr:ATP-binding protein [Oscillochloridaceae bacterium]
MTEPLNPTPTGNDTIITGNVSGTGISIGQNATSIVVIHQQNTHPLPVNLSVLKQPLIEHYTAAVFGGRDAELAALDDFLDDPNHPFGLLVAPAGLGKTALLVNWIARVQKLQWRVVFVPVSIRYQTASEQVTLSMLAHGLAEIHNDLDEFRKNDQASDRLRALIIDYLRRQLPDGTNLLLVLDGIDEALGWTVGPLLSIASPPYGLKIVVSARQLANATRENWLTDLKWDTAKVRLFDLRPLDQPAIKALLAQSVPELATDPSFVAQFYRVSEG